jgi:hypothetical protein
MSMQSDRHTRIGVLAAGVPRLVHSSCNRERPGIVGTNGLACEAGDTLKADYPSAA